MYLGRIQTMSSFPWGKYKGVKGRNMRVTVQKLQGKVEPAHGKADLLLESVTNFLWFVCEIFVLGKQ